MRLLFYLAVRSLLRSRVSLALLLFAVAAGVAFQVPNAANLNGYSQELMRQTILRATGHVQISDAGTLPLVHVSRLRALLGRLPFVRGVAPRIHHFGVLFLGNASQAIRVMGLDPTVEDGLTGLCRRVGQGRCLNPRGEGQALAGAKLAQQLGLKVGSRVRLVAPYLDLDEVRYAKEQFTIVGVMRPGGGFSEDKDLIVHIGEVSRLMDYRDEATLLAVYVDDPGQVERHVAAISGLVPEAKVQSFWEAYDFIADVVMGNRKLLVVSLSMVIVAVGVPVLAMLYIHVLRERRPIAVLGSLGFTRWDLFVIYLVQAGFVGVLGCGLGVLCGLGLCSVFEAHPIFNSEGFTVRPILAPWVIGVPLGTVFGVTLLSGLVPALMAARANPALVLRGD